MMSKEDIELYERQLQEARAKSEMDEYQMMQQDFGVEHSEKSMISEQLDLGQELDRIDNLLRGYTLIKDKKTGVTSWGEPDDKDMIILSDYGVHLIRNTIAWYLNKNTLLSNYDEKTINTKMEDFASDLNDTIFMEYEKIFKYPTFEECKAVLDKRLADKLELRKYAIEIIGKVADEEKIKEDIKKEIEPIVQKELQKIKEQIIKNKLKRFLILIREVQDAVHSTYLRAWKGQERTTLRQHIHISENKGGGFQMPQQTVDRGFLGLRRR